MSAVCLIACLPSCENRGCRELYCKSINVHVYCRIVLSQRILGWLGPGLHAWCRRLRTPLSDNEFILISTILSSELSGRGTVRSQSFSETFGHRCPKAFSHCRPCIVSGEDSSSTNAVSCENSPLFHCLCAFRRKQGWHPVL